MVESKDEQKFINNLLNEVMANNGSVWVRVSKEFLEINNSTEVQYINWMEGKPMHLNVSNCLILRSIFSPNDNRSKDSLNGLSEEVSCDHKNLVLCQKIQSSTLSQMENDINIKFNEFKNKIGIQFKLFLINSNL